MQWKQKKQKSKTWRQTWRNVFPCPLPTRWWWWQYLWRTWYLYIPGTLVGAFYVLFYLLFTKTPTIIVIIITIFVLHTKKWVTEKGSILPKGRQPGPASNENPEAGLLSKMLSSRPSARPWQVKTFCFSAPHPWLAVPVQRVDSVLCCLRWDTDGFELEALQWKEGDSPCGSRGKRKNGKKSGWDLQKVKFSPIKEIFPLILDLAAQRSSGFYVTKHTQTGVNDLLLGVVTRDSDVHKHLLGSSWNADWSCPQDSNSRSLNWKNFKFIKF